METSKAPVSTQGKGFTLLEVLVAVAILSISLASLLSSQIAAIRATGQARMLSVVGFLAESQLVEIEWQLKQDGWGLDDQTFDGDFSDEDWPGVRYVCVVDLIEMPDYNQLVEAKDAADTEGSSEDLYGVQDTGDQAFSALAMVWPVVKEAIEQSIRKSWCTVRWTTDGSQKKSRLGDDHLCGEEEINCMTVATFWTDPQKLSQLPALGGEADESDDTEEGQNGDGGGGDRGGGDQGGRGSQQPTLPQTGNRSNGVGR